MNKQIFINLPVRDLAKSMEFYTALGFSNNSLMTQENVWFGAKAFL